MVQVPALYCTLDTPDTVPLMLVVAGSTEYVSRLADSSALGCVKHKPGCFPAEEEDSGVHARYIIKTLCS